MHLMPSAAKSQLEEKRPHNNWILIEWDFVFVDFFVLFILPAFFTVHLMGLGKKNSNSETNKWFIR